MKKKKNMQVMIYHSKNKNKTDMTPKEKAKLRLKQKEQFETQETDTSILNFIQLFDYQPKYDEHYLKVLRNKAKKSWLGSIDPDKWLREIRGGYDE